MSRRHTAFITLEGIDGAGKTTHLETVAHWISARGVPFVQTREPGGTPLGERIRDLVLGQEMLPDSEALLMFAARSEHLQRVILPALQRGEWVLSDRFSDASAAYQGGGRGLGVARIAALEAWTHPGFQPDLTLLFDLPPEVAAQRLQSGRTDRDRFEQEKIAFFTRVRAAYLERAVAAPERFCVLDASLPQQAVGVQLLAALNGLRDRLA